MPVTPFHFGPAAIAKSVTPQCFSMTVFGLTQIIIDLEPLYYMTQGMWPIHRFLHTYLGATLVAIAAATAGKPLCEIILRLWNRRLSKSQREWLGVEPAITHTAAVTGALFGALSHVLLDSIMHTDIRPWAPWSEHNGLLHVLSIERLYMLCAVAGFVGLAYVLVIAGRRKLEAVRRG